jgi:hypothetical protein
MSRPANTQGASARPRRQPVGSRNRFKIAQKEDGYVYRVVNDQPGRIEDLLERGYEIVTKDKVVREGDRRVDDPSSLGSVTSFSLGKGDHGVVMRQKKEWYDEDQRSKNAKNDELDRGMKDTANQASDYGSLTTHISK